MKTPTARRFDHPLQLGGIRTGSLDYPNPLGGRSCRCAFVETGSGLRFTLNLDRGGDIVEANYHQHNLTYLTPNGHVPPGEAYHLGDRWLRSWPGGLITTCGPQFIGAPRLEQQREVTLHGHHSNTPAAVTAIHNPQQPGDDYSIELLVRDSRLFGPTLQVQRTLTGTLGEPSITLHDTVTNLSDTPVPHNWLYHVNLGYPLLDAGARFVYAGTGWFTDEAQAGGLSAASLKRLKTVPDFHPDHVGEDQQCLGVEGVPSQRGLARVGLVNPRLNLGVMLTYPVRQLPRFMNWQHFSRGGTYVTGIEPYAGSLMGLDKEPVARHRKPLTLQPGESRRYDLTLTVLDGKAACASLLAHDGDLVPLRQGAPQG